MFETDQHCQVCRGDALFQEPVVFARTAQLLAPSDRPQINQSAENET